MSALKSIDPGSRFGKLEVFGPPVYHGKKRYLRCRCDCGNTKEVLPGNLRSGRTQSCGCYQKERMAEVNAFCITHGHTRKHKKTRAYRCWTAIKKRCHNANDEHYAGYGARGITVCERWANSFENFLSDMGDPPAGMSIERVDNDRGYCKENCRWATATEQARNRRGNRPLTFRGRTACLTAWAIECGLSVGTVWRRLSRGWDVERSLTTPVNQRED